MTNWKTPFTEHPASVGETYFQHMGAAFSFGSRMVAAGFCCLLHGLLPFLFVTKGRETIATLHDEMVTNRAGRHAPAAESLVTSKKPQAGSQTRENVGAASS